MFLRVSGMKLLIIVKLVDANIENKQEVEW